MSNTIQVQHYHTVGRRTLERGLQIRSSFSAAPITGSSAVWYKGPCSHSNQPPENCAQDEIKKCFKLLLQRWNLVKGFGSKLPFGMKRWFDSLLGFLCGCRVVQPNCPGLMVEWAVSIPLPKATFRNKVAPSVNFLQSWQYQLHIDLLENFQVSYSFMRAIEGFTGQKALFQLINIFFFLLILPQRDTHKTTSQYSEGSLFRVSNERNPR